jgi:hypothetical protein
MGTRPVRSHTRDAVGTGRENLPVTRLGGGAKLLIWLLVEPQKLSRVGKNAH